MVKISPMDRCAVPTVHPVRVDVVRAKVPGERESAALAQMFRLLGDPKRTRILYALLEAGELCVCDVSAAVNVSETTVSQALRLLRTAGVVDNRRDGRMVYYRLADAHVRMILELSRENAKHEEVC